MLEYYSNFLPLLLFFLLPFLLFAKRRQDNEKWNRSINDKVLRSAGESTLAEIEILNTNLIYNLKWIGIGVSLQIIAKSLLSEFTDWRAHGMALGAVSTVCVVFLLWHLAKALFAVALRSRLTDHYHGERIVGEHLKMLMVDGYHVFHDLQFEECNVDHAVVGPGGVFAIETFVRPPKKSEGANPRVSYDGESLKWFNRKPQKAPVDTCFNRANTLQEWLAGRITQSVPVIPVLVLPGWKIEGSRDGKVKVLNPKFLSNFFQNEENYAEILEPASIKRISHQLVERSRIVLTNKEKEKADCEQSAFEIEKEEAPALAV